MNGEVESSESSVNCVGPLLVLLGALVVVNVVQLVSIVQERSAVVQTTANAAQAVARYRTVSDKLESLAKDLIRLSVSNEQAKEIITQFNIQMNQPAAGASSAAPKK